MDKTEDNAPNHAPDSVLRVKLIRTLFKFRKLVQSIAQVLDVSFGEFMVLNGISEQSRCGEDFKAAEAMEFLSVTKPAVSQILNNLEKKGYVTREISANDRRRIVVSLTKSGLETLERLKWYFDKAMTEVVNRVGEEDVSKLIELLDRLESVCEEMKIGFWNLEEGEAGK